MNIESIFEKFDDQNAFIKTTKRIAIEGTQKVALNRKGNALFNSGDVEGARRIFLTTGYSDGLVRVGDYYNSKGRPLDALRMYWIAPDRKKAEPIIIQISAVIQSLLHDEGPNNE
jgi:myo-inositol-1-phosphate synthase